MFFVINVLGCASQHPPSAKNEIIRPAPEQTLAATASAEQQPDDLSLAFDAPEVSTLKRDRTREPTPNPIHNVPAVSSEDPSAPLKIEFANRFADAKRELVAGNWRECQGAIDELEKIAGHLGPWHQQQVYELRFRAATAAKEAKLAQDSAERWLLSCGPDAVDACRRRALSALERVSRESPRKRSRQEQIARIRQSDACTSKAEAAGKSGQNLPDCVAAALTTYRQIGDQLMVARVMVARGKALESDPQKVSQTVQTLTEAQRVCSERRCTEIRGRALRSLALLQMGLGNAEAAARAALSEMGLSAEKLSPNRRPYARTAEVDRACSLLDQRQGTGACRRLEKSMFGAYTFHDFSEQPSNRAGLSVEDVRRVNQHFLVLIQECLAAQAERLEQPASVSYHLRWVALNDGRVDQVQLDRKEQDAGPLADCLRKQFAFWRYPRYRGEWQHIEQNFLVTTRDRRLAADSRPAR